MMKISTIIIILLIPLSCYSSEVYRFGKLLVSIEKVDGVSVNRSCSNKDCLAFKKYLSTKNMPVKQNDLYGGKNPLAVKCKKIMKGKVLIGVNRNGGEQSFCLFSDDSYLKLN